MAFTDLPIFPAVLTASWTSILLTVLSVVSTLLLGTYLYLWPYREYNLPFRNLRGPKPTHWFWGNLSEIVKAPPMAPHTGWVKEFGPTLRYRAMLGIPRFFSADPTALSYILSHPDLFPKPGQMRRGMTDMLGPGVLVAEGHDHRRQRKVLNPSFSAAAVREMVPIFFDKAYELKDKLVSMIEDESIEASPTPIKEEDKVVGGRKIDIMRSLGQATLDIIGIAGFNYDFKALSQPRNELAEAYRDMFAAGQSITFFGIVQALVPGMNKFPTKRQKAINIARRTTQRIGQRLVDEKKAALRDANSNGLEKGDEVGKDLLSILIRANMAQDLKADQRMSDEEMLGQITTFMLAGNETSSTSLTWTIYMLSLHPEFQRKLREEVSSVQDERPSLETLSALPYLDAVIHEGLRLLPPAPSTIRETAADCVVPLSTPVLGRDGKLISEVHLKKGTTTFIPILNINTSLDIWGPDAEQFSPERFLSMPSTIEGKTKEVPGTWGNILTFLGGTRNCIGYRFALAEMKAILFVLIRNLEFEELKSKPVIEKKSSIVMRSRIVGEETAGLQMPLMVKQVSA